MQKSQLTLRKMLLIVAVCAVFFLMLSLGVRGNYVANAIAISFAAMLLFFVMHAFCYFLVLPFVHMAERRFRKDQPTSPFADGQLPPEKTGLEEVV